MNNGDNSVFLDLMYATWPAGSEEKRQLDAISNLLDQGSLSVAARERLCEYTMRDPGDESDHERKLDVRRRLLGEARERFGHTFITEPTWMEGEER